MKATLIKVPEGYLLQELPRKGTGGAVCEGTLASTYGEGDWKLSKQNCDEIFGVVDIEKLVEKSFVTQYLFNDRGCYETGFIRGFSKAIELNEHKLFTIPQVINLCENYYKMGIAEAKFPLEKRSATSTEIIEDLKALQPQEIEVEISQINQLNIDSGKFEWKPKLDSQGCIILKRINN